MEGTLTLYTGPMHSKKTLNLIKHVLRYKDKEGVKQLVLSPNIDTRYKGSIIKSKRGEFIPAFKIESDLSVFDFSKLEGITHLYIDELQFFSHLFPFIQRVRRLSIHVIGAGLDTDFLKNIWIEMEPFLSKSFIKNDQNVFIHHLKANCTLCKTTKTAIYTARKLPMTSDSIIEPGDAQYYPTCDSCWSLPL